MFEAERDLEMELERVVKMVTLTPRAASSLAMSTMGIMCPRSMKGNKKSRWRREVEGSGNI